MHSHAVAIQGYIRRDNRPRIAEKLRKVSLRLYCGGWVSQGAQATIQTIQTLSLPYLSAFGKFQLSASSHCRFVSNNYFIYLPSLEVWTWERKVATPIHIEPSEYSFSSLMAVTIPGCNNTLPWYHTISFQTPLAKFLSRYKIHASATLAEVGCIYLCKPCWYFTSISTDSWSGTIFVRPM